MKTKIIALMAVVFFFFSFTASKDPKSTKITKGKTTNISAALADLTKNLEYDFDRPAVRNAYYKKLDLLAKAVIDNNYAVSLKGHADAIGAYKYNWVLSDKRAVNVKQYLVGKGVKESRIVTTPFGSTIPVASNSTPEGRQKNRRVEIGLKKIAD